MCACVSTSRRTGRPSAGDRGRERLPLRADHERVDDRDAVVVDDRARRCSRPTRRPAGATRTRRRRARAACSVGYVRHARTVPTSVRLAPCPNAHATCPAGRASRCPARARRCWPRRPASAPTWCSSTSKTRSRRSRSQAARAKVVKAINDAGLGRQRPVRARERVGHRVDLPRRDRGRRGRVGAARRADAAEGARPPADVHRARPAAHPDREDDRPPVARRHRSADRDRTRAHQRRGDLRGERSARDDHPRPGRHVGVDGDAVARRRARHPRVPRRLLPLRVREDPHGRARQRPAGDRRSLREGARPRGLPRVLQAQRRSSATTASGRCTPTR